jgi:hypothetical protein
LDKVIRPQLGATKADKLTRAQVAKLHGSLRDTPFQANRVLAVIGIDGLNLFDTKANQIMYAYGSLIKSDPLYAQCNSAKPPPVAVCQTGVMDLAVRRRRLGILAHFASPRMVYDQPSDSEGATREQRCLSLNIR